MRRRRRRRNGKIKVADVQSVNSESGKTKAKAICYECSAVDCVSHLQHFNSMQKFQFYLL
jgi:hypothetical protein